jgi:hypothetical protein
VNPRAESDQAVKAHVASAGPGTPTAADSGTSQRQPSATVEGEPKPDIGRPIHIDLGRWRRSPARNLMEDLLKDELREGVKTTKRHGNGDATEIRRALRRRELNQVADAIQAVPGNVHTYKLALARDQITYDPPKT